MKVTSIESLHCDAGWRNFSFLKVSTDEGLVGWSEYNESYGSKGLTGVIEKLAPLVVGEDPCAHERIYARLYAITRQAPGGINAQAIAAIENALVDIRAKAQGVPIHALLGGKVRERLRLYWSHCGSYRMSEVTAKHMGKAPLKSLDDIVKLGGEVRERGLTALKCNIFIFGDSPHMHMPGFARNPSAPEVPELNAERWVLEALKAQMAAFREGAGPEVDILLDLNFNFKTEGYLRVARALEPYELFWYEIDLFDPDALALIRRSTRTPIASCESLFGLREFRPYFERQAMDVAIIDVPWNGIWQSYKIAAMADAYEVNVAPHNFYGHLSTLMSAQFCAALPNFRIMEIDIDDVPWKDDLVTHPPEVRDGHVIVSDRPGWGADVNEEAVRAHPPKG
jgi:L-alanine-DL-glutamate epimerase-like enolase superfamily enzyme